MRPRSVHARKGGFERQGPTPPPAPNQRGPKPAHCARCARRRQNDRRAEIEKPFLTGDGDAAPETETYFLVAEAENSRISETADRLIADRSSESLGCVINDANAARGGALYDRVDICGIAKQVRDYNRFGFLCQNRFDRIRC